MTPEHEIHPLERPQLTVETLFEDLASARRERLRGWASQLDDEAALTRGAFVLAQAAAAVEQVAATTGHPNLDTIEMCELAHRMIRLAARFEQASAEGGAESIS
jgi:hypothetical protein